MTESVIDFPKDTLCPDIWEKVVTPDGMQEVWTMNAEAKAKTTAFVKELLSLAKLPMPDAIHITGSITSNSYTKNADVDVHFIGFHVREEAELTQQSIASAMKTLKSNNDIAFIASHPFEAYYQTNQFQDLMSVGCYDFFTDTWLVGPELVDQSFNPYSEYYKEIQAKSEGMAKQIRNMIFSIYEIAIVMKKNAATDFGENVRQILLQRLSEVQSLYDQIRNSRKVYSSPTSAEQALQYRASRKWKIADASFKLFDKYGYTAIMKQFIEDYKLLASSREVDIEVAEDILNTVKNYINNADKLSEQEMYENEQLDEGIASNMLIAAMLAIPGILPQDALATELSKVPKDKMHMSSAPVQKAIDAATVDQTMIGNFSYRNTVNILQWVYYTEAANQSHNGRKAIFSIVWNRAGGEAENFIPVVLANNGAEGSRKVYQFSEWNAGNNWGLVAPKTNADWKYKVPKDITNKKVSEIWKEAEEYAKQMIAGKWQSNIGKCNMIASDNDNEVAKSTWGKDCKYTIGSHRFGYDPSQDGFRKAQLSKDYTGPTTTYIVKAGDSFSKIASKYDLSVRQLTKLNNMKASSMLSIGAKLIVPATSVANGKDNNVAKAPVAKQVAKTVTVKAGDTLWKIAHDYGITVKDLATKNKISPTSTLKIGQVLYI